MSKILFLISLITSLPYLTFSQESFPKTKKNTVRETYFDKTIEDHYRWLESTQTAEVEGWVELQNKYSQKPLRKFSNSRNLLKKLREVSVPDVSYPSLELLKCQNYPF